MTLSNQYDISFTDIPKGIELALKNSDRLRTDAEILAKNERYNSAIPLVTLAVEEFGKALLLSEYFEKDTSVPHKESERIFNEHKPKIKKVLDYVENIVKSRTLSTKKQYHKEDSFHIPEEFDEQKFKNRMWYVGYQKIENAEEPWENSSWKKQPWKNPLYVDELSFGEGYNAEFGQLYYKYYELWRCVFHGIRKFRNSPLYDKISSALPPEEFSFDQIESYLQNHFFLKDNVSSISGDRMVVDIHITHSQSWITPILADRIKEHVKQKCNVKEVNIILEHNDFWN